MTEVRAARVVYQVHSTRMSEVRLEEIEAAKSRHPIPYGHLDLKVIDVPAFRDEAKAITPPANQFTPILEIEEFAILHRAKKIYRVEVVEAEPEDLDYLRSAMLIAGEIAAQCEGLIVDFLAYKAMFAEDIAEEIDQRFDPMSHISVHTEQHAKPYWVHTHGLEKFAHPDFELHGVPRESIHVARRLIAHLAAAIIAGGRFVPGERAELCGFQFEFCEAGTTSDRHFSRHSLALSKFQLIGDSQGSAALEGMLACDL